MKPSQESIKTKVYAIILFYSIAIIIRYLTNKTGILSHLENLFLKICLQGIGPAIGALLALKIFGLKITYSLSGKLKPLILSIFVFAIIPVIGFAIIGVKETENVIITSNVFIAGAKLCFYFIIYAILEEIGWRTFLQEQLNFLNQYLKYAIIGILWFVWHLNFELTTSNFVFLIILIFASWGIGKIGDKTKSILAVGAFHALYNLFSVDYFDSKGKLIVLSFSAVIWISYIVFYDKITTRIITHNQ